MYLVEKSEEYMEKLLLYMKVIIYSIVILLC